MNRKDRDYENLRVKFESVVKENRKLMEQIKELIDEKRRAESERIRIEDHENKILALNRSHQDTITELNVILSRERNLRNISIIELEDLKLQIKLLKAGQYIPSGKPVIIKVSDGIRKLDIDE